jgi:hypothetical protein
MDIRRRTKDLKIVAVLRSWRLVRMGQFRVAAHPASIRCWLRVRRRFSEINALFSLQTRAIVKRWRVGGEGYCPAGWAMNKVHSPARLKPFQYVDPDADEPVVIPSFTKEENK